MKDGVGNIFGLDLPRLAGARMGEIGIDATGQAWVYFAKPYPSVFLSAPHVFERAVRF